MIPRILAYSPKTPDKVGLASTYLNHGPARRGQGRITDEIIVVATAFTVRPRNFPDDDLKAIGG
jgi:hypothetical protein